MWVIWVAVLIFFFVLCAPIVNAQIDDDPPCYAFTSEVQVVSFPSDCFRVPNTTNFYAYTITNAGNYRFVIDSPVVVQVLNNFPFAIDVFTMREGDTYDFYLPCNYQPYSIGFIDISALHIPVTTLDVGIYKLYSTVNLNSAWQFSGNITNNKAGAKLLVPFSTRTPMKFFKAIPQ